MSVKSSGSQGGGDACGGGAVVRAGYLKKLKTFKKKYFVLRAETCESSAKLEYYDSEKKFNGGQPPKRTIPLKTCFNINKRIDTKHKHVIALYTRDDCFCIVLECEEELDNWLKALLSLQHGEEAADGETPRPTFEHVWQVTVLNRGLGGTSFIDASAKSQDTAVYRLCLTDKTLSLIRKDRKTPQAELSLSSIRSCGSLKNYFFLEVGRSSSIGAGELWMETEDTLIAQNVHHTVYHAMSSSSSTTSSKEEFRIRSSSATESSKPVVVRRPTLSGTQKSLQHAQGGATWSRSVNHQRTQSLPLANPAPPPPPHTDQNTSQPPRAAKRSNQSSKCGAASVRERCDSMPTRPRTTSEGNPLWSQSRGHLTTHRPQSMQYGRDISHSPPAGSPISPPSAACSTDSAGSSLSIDDAEPWPETTETILGRYGHSLTPDEAIAEENCDDYPDAASIPHGYVPMAPSAAASDDGYVDMSPRGRRSNMSPAVSTGSVASGPSTDLRSALEKVSTYFAPAAAAADEEPSPHDRPVRAYSVGSRPDAIKTKTRADFFNNLDSARVRAFSVGSKAKKGHGRVLPPCHGVHAHPKPKSSSAPLLSAQGAHNLDEMNDLMEMDFSRRSNDVGAARTAAAAPPVGYVEMRPGIHETLSAPYVDMRPGSSPSRQSFVEPIYVERNSHATGGQPNSWSPYNREPAEYVDMDARKPKSRQPNPPNWRTQPNYMEMTFQPRNNVSPKYSSGSPPAAVDYMDMGFQHAARTNPLAKAREEGYVEMSLGKAAAHQRQSSLDGAKVDREDYANMSGSLKKNRKKRDKARSQPINIQTAAASPYPKSSCSISPVYSSLHGGRKHSTGTPPKMFLPLTSNGLSSCSSLPRQRSRKNSRRDSKDSSSSSVTTPSSSSTIFPISLNSPGSPLKVQVAKSPETKSTGSGCPTRLRNEDYTLMDFDQRKAPIVANYVNYNPGDVTRTAVSTTAATTTTTTVPICRAPVSICSQLSTMGLGSATCFKPISEFDDYGTTSPRPGDVAPKKSSDYENFQGGECLSPVAKISRPSSVTNANSRREQYVDKPRPASVSSEMIKGYFSRPGSATSELGSSTSTLVCSRPASVNSDKIRPPSVSCEGVLHYASLDLAPTAEDEEGNRSPRLLKQNNNGEIGTAAAMAATTQQQQVGNDGFAYAEIDFGRSEGLKLAPSLSNNAKVKF